MTTHSKLVKYNAPLILIWVTSISSYTNSTKFMVLTKQHTADEEGFSDVVTNVYRKNTWRVALIGQIY